MPKRTNDFQALIAHIYEGIKGRGNSVTESAMFTDESASGREIDVLIECQVAGHDLRIAIECRDWARKAHVEWIDQLKGKYGGGNINKVIAISRKGFTSAATTKAMAYGIETLTLDNLLHRYLQNADSRIRHHAVYDITQYVNSANAISIFLNIVDCVLDPAADKYILQDALNALVTVSDTNRDLIGKAVDVGSFLKRLQNPEVWRKREIAGIDRLLLSQLVSEHYRHAVPGLRVLKVAISIYGEARVMADPLYVDVMSQIIDSLREKDNVSLDAHEFVIGPLDRYCKDLHGARRLNELIVLQRKWLDVFPDDKEARYNYALSLNLLGEHRESQKHYEEILKAKPRDKYTLFNYLESSISMRDYATARRILRKIYETFHNGSALLVAMSLEVVLNLLRSDTKKNEKIKLMRAFLTTYGKEGNVGSTYWYNYYDIIPNITPDVHPLELNCVLAIVDILKNGADKSKLQQALAEYENRDT